MANSYLPIFRPGDTITLGVTTAVTAGQLVEVGTADSSVAPAAAGSSKVVGVAGHDAGTGDLVTVEVAKAVHELTADGAITRGDLLVAADAGAVSTATEPGDGEDAPRVLFLALTSATDGALVRAIQL